MHLSSLVRVLASVALLATPAAVAATAVSPATAVAPDREPAPHVQVRARAAQPVWLAPARAHRQNPTNPLAGRLWGVYEGPQDQVWRPFTEATGKVREALATIAERPRTKWYGAFVPDTSIRQTVTDYVASSQDGNPETLAQMAVFRMVPWEGEACTRPTTPAEAASYRTWVTELAAGIGAAHTLVVMQPDGPFLLCAPDRAAKSELLTWATQTLSALPNTSVYIDAGAADWCENGTRQESSSCAKILELSGIQYARGFALDSTHYTGPVENIDRGAEILEILRADGYGDKHFIVDTAKSGRPTMWPDIVPATKKDLKNNARTCSTRKMKRCVTLGIPPTPRPADPQWGLPAKQRRIAATYVDGFVWFGRPWLFNQADPFVAQRALDMVRTTPWTATGPR
ncbi:glycoside hydrolase family 6 protein [Nocardioides okcheonensis]|uniref:glycoside hydrolase family 6 protein n=1 Tax=Nocardioides okcheonensis TaxID=2894081 RepID=UPI001E325AF1|nr:glycoside hydrolase family 6 protein [Nocardioides okcheonensis]UFN46035.1 glycoside hydrolase family 6 protein [Nocardioides okcheonensis]